MPIYASLGVLSGFSIHPMENENDSPDLGPVQQDWDVRDGSRTHQVQELVIKKYRKEDKNFEAPERARAGAWKNQFLVI